MDKEERTGDYKGRCCCDLWNCGHIPLGGVSSVGVGLEAIFQPRGDSFEDFHLSLCADSLSDPAFDWTEPVSHFVRFG